MIRIDYVDFMVNCKYVHIGRYFSDRCKKEYFHQIEDTFKFFNIKYIFEEDCESIIFKFKLTIKNYKDLSIYWKLI